MNFSPFCSLCVIFVILIRIYRMGESVHARERAREGFAVAKEKTGFRLFFCSRFPVYVIPVQSRLVLEVQVLLEVAVVPLYQDTL